MSTLPPPEPLEENSATPAGRLLVQFFLIPLFVVGIAVFVFWLFGAIAVDRKNAAELLNDVRTGSRNQRWQSAFELTKKLPVMTDPKERAAFSAAALRAYEGAANDDPRVKRYLTLVLGRLGDPRAVPLLEKALDDKDPETRLYALWALALVGNPSSAAKVRPSAGATPSVENRFLELRTEERRAGSPTPVSVARPRSTTARLVKAGAVCHSV